MTSERSRILGDNTLNFAQAKAITGGNPLVPKSCRRPGAGPLGRLDRAYTLNMMAVAHTKRGGQSAADAATLNLPLIQAAAARTIDTTAEAFKASIPVKSELRDLESTCAIGSSHLVAIVLRLYKQENEGIRRRCLNVIDRPSDIGAFGLEGALNRERL